MREAKSTLYCRTLALSIVTLKGALKAESENDGVREERLDQAGRESRPSSWPQLPSLWLQPIRMPDGSSHLKLALTFVQA